MPSEYALIYNLKEDNYYLYIDDEKAAVTEDRNIAIDIFQKMVTENPTIFSYVHFIQEGMELKPTKVKNHK